MVLFIPRGQIHLLAGRREPIPADFDGLWFVNHHCDLVQLRSSDLGTTVRVHSWN